MNLHPVDDVCRVLDRHSRWIAKLTPARRDVEADYFKAANIVAGVVHIFANTAGPETALQWMSRKKRREKLQRSQRACWSDDGRRSVLEAIDFVKLELEADASFRPVVDVGNLPMPAARTISDEHKAALVAGRQRVREQATTRVKLRRDWETSADRQNKA